MLKDIPGFEQIKAWQVKRGNWRIVDTVSMSQQGGGNPHQYVIGYTCATLAELFAHAQDFYTGRYS